MNRDLYESERKAVDLLKGLEILTGTNKLTVRLKLTTLGAGAIHKAKIKTFKTDFDKTENLWVLTLLVGEYVKYVDFVLVQIGVTQRDDGSLILYDGATLAPEAIYEDVSR
jgi:hypothetical protein